MQIAPVFKLDLINDIEVYLFHTETTVTAYTINAKKYFDYELELRIDSKPEMKLMKNIKKFMNEIISIGINNNGMPLALYDMLDIGECNINTSSMSNNVIKFNSKVIRVILSDKVKKVLTEDSYYKLTK